MTRAHKLLFTVLSVGIALTRLPARSLTMHDWDEMLFASGVPDYDVALQHPHPPGYPLFIAAAKLARLFADTDFHATQTVATIASMLIFPAAFFFACELRFRLPYAFAAATLTAFLPSIWYHGGTGLSDVPALALILFASALLLRGRQNPNAYIAGALVTALACGIRPQLLLVAAPPAVAGAIVLRRTKTIVGAWIAAAAIVAITYFAAAYFSSDFPRGYVDETHAINKHLRDVDSYHNPYRTPLRELAPRVFLFPEGGGRVKYVMAALMAIALIDALLRRRVNVALLLLMFLPISIFTWLMLDMTALARYAIAYLPLHAFLTVAGAEAITQFAPSRTRVPFVLVLTGLITIWLIKWTWPALRIARTEPSPPVAAMQWIRANVPRIGPLVYVQVNLAYHAAYFLDDYDYRIVGDDQKIPEQDLQPGNVYVFEGETQHADPRRFRRQREPLWQITRPRFFEIGILPMHHLVRWGEGWYLLETDGTKKWRWMKREADVLLTPAVYGTGELRMRLHAPVDATPRPPVVTIAWNGIEIDRTPTENGTDVDTVLRTGFSHGFGAIPANRALVEWLRTHNAGRPLSDRVRFHGFDPPLEISGAPSPRCALSCVNDFLPTAVRPSSVHDLDALLGADTDWTNQAAMFDPAASIGASDRARALRIVADDLASALRRVASTLRPADPAGYDHAVAHARTAAGLLRYHAAMASPAPDRIATLLSLRAEMMAENLLAILAQEQRRGPCLVFAHNVHLQRAPSDMSVGEDDVHWCGAGALVALPLGDRYVFLATDANPDSDPGTLQGVLAAATTRRALFPAQALRAALPPSIGAGKPIVPGHIPLTPADLDGSDAVIFVADTDGKRVQYW